MSGWSAAGLSGEGERLLETYAGLLASGGTRLGLVHLTRGQIADQIDRSLSIATLLLDIVQRGERTPDTVIDVGSGSGLPAIPISIFLRDTLGEAGAEVVMIEPKRRAVAFLEKIQRELDLLITIVPRRADQAAAENWSSTGNFVTAKALAEPERALVLCAPLCKIGGVIVLSGKSQSEGQKLAIPPGALESLGLTTPETKRLSGPRGVEQTAHIFLKAGKPGTLGFEGQDTSGG